MPCGHEVEFRFSWRTSRRTAFAVMSIERRRSLASMDFICIYWGVCSAQRRVRTGGFRTSANGYWCIILMASHYYASWAIWAAPRTWGRPRVVGRNATTDCLLFLPLTGCKTSAHSSINFLRIKRRICSQMALVWDSWKRKTGSFRIKRRKNAVGRMLMREMGN